MILFNEDWDKPENRHITVDYTTSNVSWKRTALLLKSMGVKNHLMHLQLHDSTLAGIDPHSPNLTGEQKKRILLECRSNIWYFFREVARIPSSGNVKIQPLCNRAFLSTIWLAVNHITQFLLQIRQTYKSSTLFLLETYILNIATFNVSAMLLTKDDTLRSKSSKEVINFIEALPEYLQFLGKRDIKNSERIVVSLLKNDFTIKVAQSSLKRADLLGRGSTVPVVFIDEGAYIFNLEATLPAILTATVSAREQAKASGSMYFTLIASTAGKLGSKDARFAYDIFNKGLKWTETFLDLKDEATLNEVLNKNAGEYKVMILEYNHRQLGFSDDWLHERIRVSLAKGDGLRNELLNHWTNDNISSALSKEHAKIIDESKVNDFRTTVYKHGYTLRWYITEQELLELIHTGNITIGLDTSDGLGGSSDSISLCLRDSRDAGVIGATDMNETNLTQFAEFLVDILIELPNSILVPERRSSCTAILDHMFTIMTLQQKITRHGMNVVMNPFKRIYNKITDTPSNYTDKITKEAFSKNVSLAFITKHKRAFGYTTSGGGDNSRSLLFGNVFTTALEVSADKVRDKTLANQLLGLSIKNGRIDHEHGGHDDLAIAYLLSMFFLMLANNKEGYGLKGVHLNRVNVISREGESLSKREKDKENSLKDELNFLIKKLRKSRDISQSLRMIARIESIKGQLNPRALTAYNKENLLDDIAVYKKIKKLGLLRG